jgi:hypothetical protein
VRLACISASAVSVPLMVILNCGPEKKPQEPEMVAVTFRSTEAVGLTVAVTPDAVEPEQSGLFCPTGAV